MYRGTACSITPQFCLRGSPAACPKSFRHLGDFAHFAGQRSPYREKNMSVASVHSGLALCQMICQIQRVQIAIWGKAASGITATRKPFTLRAEHGLCSLPDMSTPGSMHAHNACSGEVSDRSRPQEVYRRRQWSNWYNNNGINTMFKETSAYVCSLITEHTGSAQWMVAALPMLKEEETE